MNTINIEIETAKKAIRKNIPTEKWVESERLLWVKIAEKAGTFSQKEIANLSGWSLSKVRRVLGLVKTRQKVDVPKASKTGASDHIQRQKSGKKVTFSPQNENPTILYIIKQYIQKIKSRHITNEKMSLENIQTCMQKYSADDLVACTDNYLRHCLLPDPRTKQPIHNQYRKSCQNFFDPKERFFVSFLPENFTLPEKQKLELDNHPAYRIIP